ncbi:hypothetical protein [Micavibrio aeruginosavorus]|uniref:hypothetical protein n=1 Tax=Micavibrio aeruginosavorus TaxID=349221 RepID=UPI003F4A8BAA
MEWFNSILPAIAKIIDAIKLVVAGLFIRRSAKIEVKKDALEQQVKIQNEQLEIAARPADSPSVVRDELFGD